MIEIQLTLTQLRIVAEFLAKLKTFNFNINAKELSNIQIPGRLVSKKECLDLLRTLPSLKGEQFKNDLALADYLRIQESKDSLKFVLGGLDPKQSLEIQEALKKVVREQPVATETITESTTGSTTEQSMASGPTPETTGNIPGFGMTGAISSPLINPQAAPPKTPESLTGGKEGKGGTGTGSAVRRKIQLNEAANTPKVPNTQLKNPLQEQGPAIAKINRLQAAAANPGLKFQPGLSSNLKTFGSKTGIFAKTNLGRITNGLTQTMLPAGANLLGRSGLKLINFGGDFLSNLSNTRLRTAQGIKGAGSGISSSLSGGKKFAVVFVLVAFFLILTAIQGAIAGTTPTGEANPIAPITTIGGDISSCKFTRAGNSQLIKSSILAGWISAAATAGGIQPEILASVAMHESPEFTANADNNHDAIKSGQYCNKSKQFCVNADNSGPLHIKPGEDDPCTPDELKAGHKTAQAVGLMQNLDIYNLGKDLCSITGNLNLAVAKLKSAGLTQTPTQEQVNTAIEGYHNSCKYKSGGSNFSYCDEVWQDTQNCQPSPTPSQGTPPGPASQEKLDQIMYWTKAISNYLNPYDTSILTSPVTNSSYSTGDYVGGGYACTYLVIDSYNLAGVTGLSKNSHGWVGAMENFWRNTPGYIFFDYQQNRSVLKDILPGFAMFQQEVPGVFTGNEHVSIVENPRIDSRGDGYIDTLDSNTGHYRGWRYKVDSWIIKNDFTNNVVPGGEIITGFGGY
ncbi:hypothetical protein HYU93_05320 [Candidatus Daviesbacteria bacterium]|nr:hypothetical protein [Candidatus Daviesbacteria bacterium]